MQSDSKELDINQRSPFLKTFFRKRRTEIHIEVEESILVSARKSNSTHVLCPVCAGITMITPEQAAALTRMSMRRIYAQIEAEMVHYVETPDGLFLCANSLT